MRSLITILIFFSCICKLLAQPIYFNNRYDFYGFPEVPWNIIKTDSGYMTFGGVNDDFTLINSVGIMHIDSTGNLLWKKSFGRSGFSYYTGGPGSLVKTIDGGYAIGGSVQDSTGNDDAMLYKFNKYGDTLWTQGYGDGAFQAGRQCKKTADSGYIIIGVTASSDPLGDFWLIKTDSLGNIEWDITYGGGGVEDGLSVGLCTDGGYILAGTSGPNTNLADAYVIKTDSLGNEQWNRTFGSPLSSWAWNVEQTSDGGYIVGGGLMDDNLQSTSRPYIIKLDSAGNTEWYRTNGPIRFNTTVFMVRELADGSFISAGQVTDFMGSHGMGLVLKLAANGDSIWYRTHEILAGIDSENRYRDIRLTDDGGFIAAGWLKPDPPDTGGQDMWITKMDSCGCLYLGCDSVCQQLVGIEDVELDDEDFGFIVYPNPFSGTATVKLNQQIAIHNSQLYIFDITGRKVKSYLVPEHNSTLTLFADEIGVGMFFVQLSDENEVVATRKVIVTK